MDKTSDGQIDKKACRGCLLPNSGVVFEIDVKGC